MSESDPEDILACLESPSHEDSFLTPLPPSANLRALKRLLCLAVGFCLAASAWYFSFLRAPSPFPSHISVSIPMGIGLSGAATALKQNTVIRSPFWFKVLATLLVGPRGVKAGEYAFDEPVSVVTVAWRITHSDFRIVPIKVTVPEGLSNREIAALLSKSLPHFIGKEFLRLAIGKEGYLFPDTYSFLPNINETGVISAMEDNFQKRTLPLHEKFIAFGKPLSEIVIMASLVEEEARTTETRKIVAGILWKRLALGMPLQVDAVFPYIFQGKPYDLTDGDLKVDSPYNTYAHTGLPPTPISNPGLDSLLAAISPTETPYFYYLSDREGVMHCAKTHEEHVANRAKYLGR